MEAAYGQKMTGEGATYRERQKERVECGECRKEMATGSLASHQMTQPVQAKEDWWSWEASATGGDPSAGLPDQGKAEELPCGGLPRKGWDTDGDEDAFLSQACPGHRDHIGGGKPPTPKVLTMQLAGPVADPQWET